tara:strand:- start:7175 stop:7384 length:210 start_codon:yes stop_codon:yes gene_type:complete
MNRFDTVELKDGTLATVIGIEKLLGETTGHVLVSVTGLESPVVVDIDDLTLVKKYTAPKIYPHIDEQAY